MRTLRNTAPGLPETPRHDPSPLTREAVARYEELRLLYGAFCRHVRQTLSDEITGRSIKIHSIEARAKSVEIFERKVRRLLGAQRATRLAREPLMTVTDMAGVRVITFFPKTVNEVDSVVRDRFRVLEKDNKSESRAASGSCGYHSVHYLVEFAPEHLDRSDRR